MNQHRTPIFVAAYPKSGSTWLTRLLADILNCPAGGSYPSEDDKELASEGWERPEPIVVRKGHYWFVNANVLNPGPHQLCLEHLLEERIVHIVRDPRDIAVSASLYHDKPLRDVISGMVKGTQYGLPPWASYVKRWRELAQSQEYLIQTIRYEDLLKNAVETMEKLLHSLALPYDPLRLPDAVHRQQFTNRWFADLADKTIDKEKRDLNVKLMRRGVSGDWRKYFDRKLGWVINLRWVMQHWRPEMEILDYEC